MRTDGVDSTHEWMQLAFSTVNGGPVAGNINADWAFGASGVQFTEPWRFMNFFLYWTQNGVAVSNLQPFASGAFGVVNPNPLNPALGEVFGSFGDVQIVPTPKPITFWPAFSTVLRDTVPPSPNPTTNRPSSGWSA